MQDDFSQGFVSDEDEDLKSKSGSYPKFGLNTGEITKFEFNPNGGSGGTEGDCLDIEITIEEKVIKQRLFPVSKIYGKNGEITDTTSAEYQKKYAEATKQLRGVLTHFMKIFFTEEELKSVFNKPIPDAVTYFKTVAEAVNRGIAVKGKDVDIFLQYQWNIKDGQDRTYLEIPKNLKDGSYICKAIAPVGEWKEVRSEEGLSYKDNAGNTHRFVRSKDYLESNKAIQQKTSSATPAGDAAITGQAPVAQGGTGNAAW